MNESDKMDTYKKNDVLTGMCGRVYWSYSAST